MSAERHTPIGSYSTHNAHRTMCGCGWESEEHATQAGAIAAFEQHAARRVRQIDTLAIVFAVRYALSRRSYANIAMGRELVRIAREVREIDPVMAANIVHDIERALEEGPVDVSDECRAVWNEATVRLTPLSATSGLR